MDDPLRRDAATAADWDEPLSSKKAAHHGRPTADEQERAAAVEWEGQKAAILQRFTASGSIAVTRGLDVVTQPGGHMGFAPEQFRGAL